MEVYLIDYHTEQDLCTMFNELLFVNYLACNK